jgi:hypothetical protein
MAGRHARTPSRILYRFTPRLRISGRFFFQFPPSGAKGNPRSVRHAIGAASRLRESANVAIRIPNS